MIGGGGSSKIADLVHSGEIVGLKIPFSKLPVNKRTTF